MTNFLRHYFQHLLKFSEWTNRSDIIAREAPALSTIVVNAFQQNNRMRFSSQTVIVEIDAESTTVTIDHEVPPAITEIGVITDSADNPFTLRPNVPDSVFETSAIWSTNHPKYTVDDAGRMSYIGPMPTRPEWNDVKVTAIIIANNVVLGTATVDLDMSVRGILLLVVFIVGYLLFLQVFKI